MTEIVDFSIFIALKEDGELLYAVGGLGISGWGFGDVL